MRILMVTNDSSQAKVVLCLGAQIACRAGEPPTVLAVIEHESDLPLAVANMILARARKLLEPEVPNVRTKVRIGRLAEEIICEAREGSYDLVIVGEKPRRNLLARRLPGLTMERVIKRAPCPVIIVKRQAGPIHRVLLCDSGAGSSWVRLPAGHLARLMTGPAAGLVTSPALPGRFTARLADLLDDEGDITVLHVMSQMGAGPGVRGKHLRADAEELIGEHTPEGGLLEQDMQILERSGIHLHPKVRHGLVVDEILAEAREGDYDLVVIGAQRDEGWRRILLDDLAHKIMDQLDRPLLIVR
jgi:nucleotide-binding universal stress UspA family protein